LPDLRRRHRVSIAGAFREEPMLPDAGLRSIADNLAALHLDPVLHLKIVAAARSQPGRKLLEAMLAAEKERAEKESAGQLAAEQAASAANKAALADKLSTAEMRADKAIAAFAALAERLDALLAERSRRTWWRRLVTRFEVRS